MISGDFSPENAQFMILKAKLFNPQIITKTTI